MQDIRLHLLLSLLTKVLQTLVKVRSSSSTSRVFGEEQMKPHGRERTRLKEGHEVFSTSAKSHPSSSGEVSFAVKNTSNDKMGGRELCCIRALCLKRPKD